MLEKDEKMPVAETLDTPLNFVKAETGTEADMSAVDTLTSPTRFNVIRKLITLIEFVISFFSGDIGLTLRTLPDGTQTVFFGRKEQLSEVHAEEVQKKKKNWKDNPNADVLQTMIDDKLLEPFNTADVRGLKLTKDFLSDKFAKYESSFGSMKAFALLGEEEGILFSVTGRPLNRTNLREYRETH